jgi:uridine kinase
MRLAPLKIESEPTAHELAAANGRAKGSRVMDLLPAIDGILAAQRKVPRQESCLVGLSGIDGSGKGYVSAQLSSRLSDRGGRVAAINVDEWLNLPTLRFNPNRPAEHFYEHPLRLDEMFAQFVLPLRQHRSHRLMMNFAGETAVQYEQNLVAFDNVDIILQDGIFLFKPVCAKLQQRNDKRCIFCESRGTRVARPVAARPL